MKESVIDVRLNKYLSEIGYCSRRVADKLIEESRVKINGKIVSMGQKVKYNDIVEMLCFLARYFLSSVPIEPLEPDRAIFI